MEAEVIKEGYKMKKWYVLLYSAEEYGASVVELDEIEHEAMRRAFDAELIAGGGYCGSCSISYKSFNTREEAIRYARMSV